MKVMNLLLMLGLAVSLSGGKVFAHYNGGHGHHHNPPPHHHHPDDDADDLLASTLLLELMTLTELSEATTNDQKIAILNASPDALGVLEGQAPTDLFLNGKAAVEKLLNMQFENDRDAAFLILEYAEESSKK